MRLSQPRRRFRRRYRRCAARFTRLLGEPLEPRIALALGDLLNTFSDPAATPQSQAQAGTSVAMDGGYAVVGVPSADVSGNSHAGIAYLYDSASGNLLWTLNDPAPADNDYFGSSVAISGSLIVVGANQKNLSKGAAYVF